MSDLNLAEQIKVARLAMVEHALVGFIEEIDGRIPDEETILREGIHLAMADSPLAIYEKAGQKFRRYYCWRRKHLIALGFLDGEQPLTLFTARVPDDKWPGAVTAYVGQHGIAPEEPPDHADDWQEDETDDE